MSSTVPCTEQLVCTTNVRSQICRVCFSLTDLLIPIFDVEGVEIEIKKKIEKHLPIKVSPTDILPLQVCFQCTATLLAWDSLIDVCVETNKKLLSFFAEEPMDLSEATDNKMEDSDDEPLMPPKKRKLTELKSNSNTNNINNNGNHDIGSRFNLSKVKSKQKKVASKKLKNKSKEIDGEYFEKLKKTDEVGNVGSAYMEEKSECNGQSYENLGNYSDAGSETNLSENKLSTVVKAEVCESDGETANPSEDLANVSNNSSAKCEFCNKTYKDKRYLSSHIKKVHDKAKQLEAQKCNVCGNIYKTRANLERHYTKEHLSDQVQCPVCHLSLNSKKMDSHLRSKHGVKTKSENEERFKCKFCLKWFKNKYVRNSHVKEVHLSEPMKCKLCDFVGVRPLLRRHRRDVHSEKRFPCSLCHGAFKTLHTLKMHMTAHSDLRCYTCDICGMGFKRLNNVRDHMKCHEQKSNQCQICGNFFARKRYLAIHEKTIHNFYADGVIPEEKGFECGTCGAKLKWKKNLLAHMRIHTGEKPYVCKICKKDFICHGSLRTHMAKHGVCAASENAALENSQDPQAHLALEMNVFSHFNPPQV